MFGLRENDLRLHGRLPGAYVHSLVAQRVAKCCKLSMVTCKEWTSPTGAIYVIQYAA